MADLDFDYAAAKRDGYSDLDILRGLQSSGRLSFDLDRALKDNHDPSDILSTIYKPKAPEPTPEPSSLLRRAGDYGISALKGAISVPETAVGLADLITGGYAGKGAEAIGFRPQEAKDILNEYYSPEQKAANRRVAEAQGFIGTGKALLENPSVLAQTGVESLPLMGAGGVVGRGAVALAPRLGAALGGAVGEGVVQAGQAAEQYRQANPNRDLSAGQAGAALASGIGTGIFGAVGGRIAQKLGIEDIDTALVQAGSKAGGSKGIARRFIEGGISEGVFEELPQSIQEQLWQNVALDKPLFESVPENAAQGLLAGGLFGGVAGAALHGGNAPAQPEVNPDTGDVRQLEYRPDPFISFPDGSVGRQSDADAFINGLPEGQRVEARARLYGYQSQPVTPEDILNSQSVDQAIAIANRAVEEGTPEFRAQRNNEIDAAWNQFLGEKASQRMQDFDAALQQRRERDLPAAQSQRADQIVQQAMVLTDASGYGDIQPTAIEEALRRALGRQEETETRTEQQRIAGETDAAYQARQQEISAQRQTQFEKADAERRRADSVSAQIQASQQQAELGNALSAELGLPEQPLSQMQLAFQRASQRGTSQTQESINANAQEPGLALPVGSGTVAQVPEAIQPVTTAGSTNAAQLAANTAQNEPVPAAPSERPTGQGVGNGVTEQRASPAVEEDDGSDIPVGFMRKVKVPHEVYVEDDGQYETVNLPADKALASVREDIADLRALLKCLRG